jgi:hypothetical protein
MRYRTVFFFQTARLKVVEGDTLIPILLADAQLLLNFLLFFRECSGEGQVSVLIAGFRQGGCAGNRLLALFGWLWVRTIFLWRRAVSYGRTIQHCSCPMRCFTVLICAVRCFAVPVRHCTAFGPGTVRCQRRVRRNPRTIPHTPVWYQVRYRIRHRVRTEIRACQPQPITL